MPVIYCAAKAGYASVNQPADGGLPDNDNLEPLFEAIISTIPAPEYEEGAPLQAHVANIDSSDFLGRLGLVRIYNGTLEKGKTYGLSRVDGSLENFRVSELLRTQGLERIPGRIRRPRRHRRRRRRERHHDWRDHRRPRRSASAAAYPR